MKAINKLICRLFGHNFISTNQTNEPFGIIELNCKRCNKKYNGNSKEWNEQFK